MTSERLVIGMASIFGDESADEKVQIVFAVAALVGLESQWEAVEEEWLKITKGRDFHANQWETSPYGRDSYNDLASLLASSGLRGQGVAIDLKEFRASFPDLRTQDYAYHKCFIETLNRLLKVCADQGYKDLKLTFDGRQGSGTTGLLYDSITSQTEWADAFDFAEEISFGNRKNPRIQMADMLARETMRGFLSGIQNMEPKEPLRILGRSNERIWFDFLVEDYFSQWRNSLPRLAEETGLHGSEYFAWIKRKNMQDNLNSRIRYMIWNDAETLRKKRGRP